MEDGGKMELRNVRLSKFRDYVTRVIRYDGPPTADDYPDEARVIDLLNTHGTHHCQKIKPDPDTNACFPIDLCCWQNVYELKTTSRCGFWELDRGESGGAFIELYKFSLLVQACGEGHRRDEPHHYFKNGYYVYTDATNNVYAISVFDILAIKGRTPSQKFTHLGSKPSYGWMIPTGHWQHWANKDGVRDGLFESFPKARDNSLFTEENCQRI